MKTRTVKIGNLSVGGDSPVRVKGMLKTSAAREKTLAKEAIELEKAGAEALRVAFKEERDIRQIKVLRRAVGLPLAADIHFNPRFALMAIDAGFDEIRLNPMNLSKKKDVREIVRSAARAGISIRIGINSGGFQREYASPSGLARAMVKKTLNYIKLFEDEHFFDIMVSLKASSVLTTVLANRIFAGQCRYPLHLGVTATGPFLEGVIKSSLGLGQLLSEGIGDIIRVSLTAPGKNEIYVAQAILQFLGIRDFFTEIVSCPTCGRCQVDLMKLVNRFKERIAEEDPAELPRTIALMGCVVNGPGEATQADIGVAFGKDKGAIFRKGKIIGTTTQKTAVEDMLRRARNVVK